MCCLRVRACSINIVHALQLSEGAMDGDSSDGSFSRRARSLGWRSVRSANKTNSPQDDIQSGLPKTQPAGAMERKLGESRRTTTKMLREERLASGGVAQAPTTDITALMDNYFFFNNAAAATRALGAGGLLHGSNHAVTDYNDNGANDIDLYGDNGELETRFVRTLEWVGQASKAISPPSSLSRESLSTESFGGRSLRVPGNSMNASVPTNNLETVSINNNGLSKRNTVNLNDNQKVLSVPGDVATESMRQAMNASTLQDDFENTSFRLPPNAILRADHVHATSFRAPAKSDSNVDSKVIRAYNLAYGEVNIPMLKPASSMEGPGATCKLPCQSCGNGQPKKGDNLHYQDHVNHGYTNADKLYSKPNYAMGHYDRNDRLARSAYHHTSQRKPLPSENDNLPNAQKVTSITKTKDGQQQKEKIIKATEKASKDKASPAAKVQQWFSKLIGKSSKQDNANSLKTSTKATSEGQASSKPPLRTDYDLVIHGATMQDVLTNKRTVGNHNQTAPKPKLEEAQPQLRRQPPQAARPPIPKPRAVSTNPRADAPADITAPRPANLALNNAYSKESTVPSRRFADDAHSQRFGYGSKSERWAPLHLRQAQQRQTKDSYQQDKQSLMQAPTQINSSKSARSSPTGRAGQWREGNMNLVVASSDLTVRNDLDLRFLKNKQMGEQNGRDPFLLNKGAQYIERQFNANQYAKEANVMNDRQEINTKDNNSRAFVASYASQSERFSRRHRTPREREVGRRSIDTRVFPDNMLAIDQNPNAIKGDAVKENELVASLPPPSDEDRDIEVLNKFLVQKKSNLHLCSSDSRLHFILSNSSLSSMIAAICYAWTLHHSKSNKVGGWERVPVMIIARNHMWNYKQLAWLFEQAGLDTKALIFINEVDLDAVADSVGEYRISRVGQDIVRLRGEVASYCTVVAEAFFKEVEAALQAKCIRILLLAGLLLDTDNLDCDHSVVYTRRDELAASLLLPQAGHKGRAVLLAELKRGHESKEFQRLMCESYGEQKVSGALPSSGNLLGCAKQDLPKINDTQALVSYDANKPIASNDINLLSSSSDYYHTDFFSEEDLSAARSKSSKSYTSLSTLSTDQGKSRSSSTSPTITQRNKHDLNFKKQSEADEEPSP